MSSPLYVPLDDRGIVSVDGPEAGAFLQGLISNDIDLVTEARSIYAALLTPQGKFLHDFFVLRQGDGYLLDCEGPRVGDLGGRLVAYRLRADVALADATEDFRVVALFGGEALEGAFDLPPGEGGAAPCAGGTLMRDPRSASLGLRAVLPRGADLAFLERAGFARGHVADYERHRIAHGAPDGSRDMEVGRATLMECGFEALNGVDFEKGCYVGQELTGAHQAPRPGAPASRAGRAGGAAAARRHADHGGRAGGGRDSLRPRRCRAGGAAAGEDRRRHRGGRAADGRRLPGYPARSSLRLSAAPSCAMAAWAAARRATGTR